jgi:hypothetical protein
MSPRPMYNWDDMMARKSYSYPIKQDFLSGGVRDTNTVSFNQHLMKPNWEEESLKQQYGLRQALDEVTPLKQPEKYPAQFKPNEPRYIYRRNAMESTRKSNKKLATDKSQVGDISRPSEESKGEYPKTKIMQGWERIKVGEGKMVRPGRPKKGRTLSQYQTVKPMRSTFVPNPRTYRQTSQIAPKAIIK